MDTRIVGSLISVILCLIATVVHGADAYPSRPLRIIVPASAGGGSEILARRLAMQLEPALGQPVVLETKPGASGTIGTAAAARAPADGYTLLLGHIGTFGMVPNAMPSLPYDPIKDFAPVTTLTVSPALLLVNATLPVRTAKELVALAKAQPGKLSYCSSGLGSPQNVAMELFKQRTGIDAVHVPYKGSAPALVDLAGGQVAVGFDYAAPAAPHVKGGKIRALAVTGDRRLAWLPDVPTMREAGFADIEIDTWTGILVPTGTPQPIVDRLNREIEKAMRAPEVEQRVEELGSRVMTGTPAQFAALIKSELARWGTVIRQAGIRIE